MAQHCTKKIQVIRHSAASSRSFAFEKKKMPQKEAYLVMSLLFDSFFASQRYYFAERF